MNNSNKYNAVLEKLKKLVAMKWDLETVLKNKDNILNPPYSKFPLKTNSNTNMTTPKVNNLFPHLQTVNVDTTPRRKRGGMEMSPSNTFSFSTYNIDNNIDDKEDSIDELTNTFNEMEVLDTSTDNKKHSVSKKKRVLFLSDDDDDDDSDEDKSAIIEGATRSIGNAKFILSDDDDDDDDDDNDDEKSPIIKSHTEKAKFIMNDDDDDDDDEVSNNNNLSDIGGETLTYSPKNISVLDENEIKVDLRYTSLVEENNDNTNTDEDDDDDNDEEENLSPLIYTARKGLRKFTFHDSDDESSIDEEQEEEQSAKNDDVFIISSPSNMSNKNHTYAGNQENENNHNRNNKYQNKIFNLLSDSDDDEIDAKFSSLSDRLSKRTDINNSKKFDLLKTNSKTAKLILNENDIINNNSPSILSLTNEKNKSENENYPTFTPSQWKKQKLIYTTKLYAEFNDIVFDSQLPKDLEIDWSIRLNKTAGLTYTNYKNDGGINGSSSNARVRNARIELSSKVLTDLHRLKATLLHELCHAAAWIIDGVRKPPHGKAFKKWGNVAKEYYPNEAVTTCHNYEIHYKYQWKCTQPDCTWKFGRHSKSLSIEKHRCGKCSSKIEFIGKFDSNGNLMKERKVSEYQKFVKKMNKKVRLGNPSYDFGEIQQHISKLWEEEKNKKNMMRKVNTKGSSKETAFVLLDDDIINTDSNNDIIANNNENKENDNNHHVNDKYKKKKNIINLIDDDEEEDEYYDKKFNNILNNHGMYSSGNNNNVAEV